jgi:hypothetical protein
VVDSSCIWAFDDAKANTRNGIFPFPRRAPWVRFVIFVVQCFKPARFYGASRHRLIQCPAAGRKEAAAQPVCLGLPTSYAAFRWWDPTRAGSEGAARGRPTRYTEFGKLLQYRIGDVCLLLLRDGRTRNSVHHRKWPERADLKPLLLAQRNDRIDRCHLPRRNETGDRSNREKHQGHAQKRQDIRRARRK